MKFAQLLKVLNSKSKASSFDKKQAEQALITLFQSNPDFYAEDTGAYEERFDNEDIKNLSRILIQNKDTFSLKSFKLVYIKLVDPEVMTLLAQALESQPELQGLNLTGCSISFEGMNILFTALRKLNLTSLNLSEVAVPSLVILGSYLEHNKNLKVLEIKKIYTKDFNDLSIALASHPSLEVLDLYGNWVGDSNFSDFLNALITFKNTTLRSLTFGFNNYSDPSAYKLAEYLKLNTDLAHLSMFCDPLSMTDGFKALINSIKTHPSLTSLEMSGFFRGGASTLAQELLTENTHLTKCTLSLCQFDSKKAADLLKSLPQESQLKELGLYCNCIEDKDLAEFLEALANNHTLEHIDLRLHSNNDNKSLQLVQAFAKSSLLSFDMHFGILHEDTLREMAKILESVKDRVLDLKRFKNKFYCSYHTSDDERKFKIIEEALQNQNLIVQRPKAILASEQKRESVEQALEKAVDPQLLVACGNRGPQ